MTAIIPAHMLYTPGDMPGDNVLHQLAQMQPVEAELPEWKRKRLGKITASCFGMVKKLKTTGQWGDTALSYLYDLVGEHLTGQPSDNFTGSKATEWGNFYEADALKAYTKRTGKKVQPSKFLPSSMPWVGGTPDGFVGEKGLVEAKCPLTFKNHLRTVIKRTVPDEYLQQVLGQLWLSGREWCDFVSYDPRIEGAHGLVIVRVKAADYQAEIEKLAGLVAEFHGLLLSELKALKVKPGINFNL